MRQACIILLCCWVLAAANTPGETPNQDTAAPESMLRFPDELKCNVNEEGKWLDLAKSLAYVGLLENVEAAQLISLINTD